MMRGDDSVLPTATRSASGNDRTWPPLPDPPGNGLSGASQTPGGPRLAPTNSCSHLYDVAILSRPALARILTTTCTPLLSNNDHIPSNSTTPAQPRSPFSVGLRLRTSHLSTRNKGLIHARVFFDVILPSCSPPATIRRPHTVVNTARMGRPSPDTVPPLPDIHRPCRSQTCLKPPAHPKHQLALDQRGILQGRQWDVEGRADRDIIPQALFQYGHPFLHTSSGPVARA